MTTLTEPPLITPSIDVSELPALDQPDERVCEIRVRFGSLIIPCENAAAWAMSGTCDSCHKARTRLACDDCKRGMTESGPGVVACIYCHVELEITRVERIR